MDKLKRKAGRMRILIGVSLLASGLIGCNPAVNVKLLEKYDPSQYAGSISHTQVEVYEQDEACPTEAVAIGEVFVGEAGATVNCGYNEVLEIARMRASKVGANALCIDRHRKPGFGSSCHQIWARMLYEERKSEPLKGDSITTGGEKDSTQTDSLKKDPNRKVSVKIYLISGKDNHKVEKIPVSVNGEFVTRLNHPSHELIVHEGPAEITLSLDNSYNKYTFVAEDRKEYYFELLAHKQSFSPWSIRLRKISAEKGKQMIDEINKFWASTPLRKKIPPQMALGAYYGTSIKMGSTENLEPIDEELYDGMRWGTSISGRLDFFFGRTGGLGFHYDRMNTSNGVPNQEIFFEGSQDTLSGTYRGSMEIESIGISYLRRHYSLNGLLQVTFGMGLSYNNYYEDLEIGDTPLVQIEGNTIGFNFSLRGDIFVTRWLAISAEANLVASNLTKLHVSGMNGSYSIDLSETEESLSGSFATFSGGLRFCF